MEFDNVKAQFYWYGKVIVLVLKYISIKLWNFK